MEVPCSEVVRRDEVLCLVAGSELPVEIMAGVVVVRTVSQVRQQERAETVIQGMSS